MIFVLYLLSIATIEWILARKETKHPSPSTRAQGEETTTADLLALAQELADKTPDHIPAHQTHAQQTHVQQDTVSARHDDC
jgi:hypothetical protein